MMARALFCLLLSAVKDPAVVAQKIGGGAKISGGPVAAGRGAGGIGGFRNSFNQFRYI